MLAAFLASGFFLSHLLYRHTRNIRFKLGKGCGLIGSALALAAWIAMPPLGAWAAALLAAAVTLAGVAAAQGAQAYYGQEDDPRVVIDEFAGYLWSVVFLPKQAWVLIAAFIGFRLLDVFKPLGIRRLEELPGGLGCMMDDVAAGWLTALILASILFFC